MNKYEQLIEHIINDESDKARELFHNIVVEKSRDIYENLVAEEDQEEVDENAVSGLVDEITLDEQGITEEEDEEGEVAFDVDGEEGAEGEEEHEEIEDRVEDLEAALDELKAEFDALMADEANEPEHHDGIDDPEFGGEEAGEELGESKEEDEEEDEEEVDESIVREYVEKVADVAAKSESGKQAGADGSIAVNKQSTVAGKNDMGGTAALSKGGNQNQDGTSPTKANNYGTKSQGALIGKVQNTPGSDAGKSAYKTKESAKTGEGQTTDGSVPVSAKSPVAK